MLGEWVWFFNISQSLLWPIHCQSIPQLNTFPNKFVTFQYFTFWLIKWYHGQQLDISETEKKRRQHMSKALINRVHWQHRAQAASWANAKTGKWRKAKEKNTYKNLKKKRQNEVDVDDDLRLRFSADCDFCSVGQSKGAWAMPAETW